MKWQEFDPGDLLAIENVDERVLSEERGSNLLAMGARFKAKGPCLTLTNGKPIACGGLVILWPGSAEIWLRLDKNRAGPEAAREMRSQMYRWIEQYHLDRVQAMAQREWEEDRKFLRWLGMKSEGEMRKFGPNGVDQVRYAWVRP